MGTTCTATFKQAAIRLAESLPPSDAEYLITTHHGRTQPAEQVHTRRSVVVTAAVTQAG